MKEFDSHPEIKRVEDKAVIVIYRQMMLGAIVVQNIYLDKQLIGKSAWDRYLHFIHEFHNDTPLMIVDNIRDWIMSSNVKVKS